MRLYGQIYVQRTASRWLTTKFEDTKMVSSEQNLKNLGLIRLCIRECEGYAQRLGWGSGCGFSEYPCHECKLSLSESQVTKTSLGMCVYWCVSARSTFVFPSCHSCLALSWSVRRSEQLCFSSPSWILFFRIIMYLVETNTLLNVALRGLQQHSSLSVILSVLAPEVSDFISLRFKYY